MDKLYDSETGCCKRFNPKPWDKKKVDFEETLFLKDHFSDARTGPGNGGT